MSKIAESSPGYVLAAAVMLVLFAGCAAAWTMIAVRWRRRQPLLPYEPRRPVPWRGADALLVLVVYVVLPALVEKVEPVVPAAAAEGEGNNRHQLPAAPSGPFRQMVPSPFSQRPRGTWRQAPRSRPAGCEEVSTEHPWTPVGKSDSRLAILMGGMIAMVIAPLVEELLLRLTVQGWLEAARKGAVACAAWLRRCLPGVIPVAVVSFASPRSTFASRPRRKNCPASRWWRPRRLETWRRSG